MSQPLFTPGKDPVSIVQEAGWAPGPIWKGAENPAPPPGFDPRTVQPVASRDIRVHNENIIKFNKDERNYRRKKANEQKM